MARIIVFFLCFLVYPALSQRVSAEPAPEYGKRHSQTFGLTVEASVVSTTVVPSENTVALDVTLKNGAEVPIIFESCECSFSDHWTSDNPLVTIKKSSDCAGNDCADVQLLPGQELIRQISLHMAPESLAGYQRKIDFKVGFRLWDIPGSTPYWSNVVSIEREE